MDDRLDRPNCAFQSHHMDLPRYMDPPRHMDEELFADTPFISVIHYEFK
jgi:hypothetical protein